MTQPNSSPGNLSQAELDTLFESIQVAQQRVRPQQAAVVSLYDFRLGSKLSPDQMRQIQEVLQTLARVLRRTLGVYLNASVWLELKAVSQGTGEQYLSNLPDHPITALFELVQHTPKAAWQIDAGLTQMAMHCMLGGCPEHCETAGDREITQMEAAILKRLYREMVDTWGLTWPLLGAEQPQIREVVGNLAQLDVELRHEQVVMALFEADFAGRRGRMWMGLPATVLQILLRKAEHREAGRGLSPAVLGHARATQVQLRAVLSRRRMWLSELADLRKEAVIPLGQHAQDPVQICLAGRCKFHAQTGVRRGRLAVKITRAAEEG